ncbi:MAG: hypothetical protein IJS13_07850 [Paludibacteraceae bacterium]|nr:hypothetical protein [Paludibacteraceae bacterium]
MHGFFGTYGVKVCWDVSRLGKHLIRREYSDGVFSLLQLTHEKFLNDKVWYDSDEVFIATEGVLLNSDELRDAYGEKDLGALLCNLYRQKGAEMITNLRGSFAGVIYDKRKQQCAVFNDQIGSRILYVCRYDAGIVWASDLSVLQDVVEAGPSHSFAASMITYGYSPIGETPVNGVVRIGAGHMISMRNGEAKDVCYHRFERRATVRKDMRQYVEEFDVLFCRAVERILKKNKEYGLLNYMPLSAGLDSRMTVMAAHRLTTGKITNFTYSQSGYYDETIPRHIARELGNDWLFHKLDGGDYLKNFEKYLAETDGLIQFSGAAQVDQMVHLLPTKNIGVIATGMLGDIVANAYSKGDGKIINGEGALSKKLSGLLSVSELEQLPKTWSDRELYYLYVRGFNCANLGGPIVFQQFTESFSPFCDVDVVQYCFCMPQDVRWNYNFYDEWVKRCYPQACKWLHNGVQRIGHRGRLVEIAGRQMLLKDVPKRVVMKLLRDVGAADLYTETSGGSMNPEDSWLKENNELRECFDNYYAANKYKLLVWQDVYHGAEWLYENGTANEKMQVLTLLAAIGRYEVKESEG